MSEPKEIHKDTHTHTHTHIYIYIYIYIYTHLFLWLFEPIVMSSLYGASRSQSDTPHSVRLLWTSDQPTHRPLPDNTQHSQSRNIRTPVRSETTIVASKRTYSYTLDRAATATGYINILCEQNVQFGVKAGVRAGWNPDIIRLFIYLFL